MERVARGVGGADVRLRHAVEQRGLLLRIVAALHQVLGRRVNLGVVEGSKVRRLAKGMSETTPLSA